MIGKREFFRFFFLSLIFVLFFVEVFLCSVAFLFFFNSSFRVLRLFNGRSEGVDGRSIQNCHF